jgi:hypothetical protein
MATKVQISMFGKQMQRAVKLLLFVLPRARFALCILSKVVV